ncbi:MAG: OmpA family protein [Bacteroidia bacterium]|nr:OmpA family protein [Bacteroidia bacterium]
MNKILHCFIFVLFCPLIFMTQNIEFEKKNFPDKKDELREIKKKLEQGIELFMEGRKELEAVKEAFVKENKYMPVSVYDYQKAGYKFFKQALPLFLEAQKFNPNNARLNYMLGIIKFFDNLSPEEHLPYLKRAFELDPTVEPDLNYWLGWSYHLNSKWDDAIRHYQYHIQIISEKSGKQAQMEVEDMNKKIQECQNGKKYSARPLRVFVDNLGPNVNTRFPEYGAQITSDESIIIFTARRDNSTGGQKDNDNEYMEDIYISVKENGKWTPSRHLSKNINTDKHDAIAGLSPDGGKIYVYRHSGSDGGDLYESVQFGNDWEVPVHMNKNINTKYHESSVSLSFDGRKLFFVSDKPSGFGNRDIYVSELDVKGEWGPAKNLGPEINTKYGEEGVMMHPDGVTMYFSSKGHDNMGGYDIFKSEFKNGKWTKPENLGYPINGPDDDVFYVVAGSGTRAYFASAKAGGYGDKDIYRITFLGPEKPPITSNEDQLLAAIANPVSNLKPENEVEVKLAKLTILKGIVYDFKTNEKLEASIDLIDNDKNQVLATFKSNATTGKYLVNLPSGKNYGIAVRKDGYLFHSENFIIPEAAEYQEFEKNIPLKKVEVGNVIVLKNIFFDFDKATLRPESMNELDRLVKLLNDNPTLKIELSSHTDSKGSDEYNMKLSENRSKSVVDYLISKGISASRLVAKGYGETKPIDTNDTEEGRQNNRRTEFKILEK